MKNALDQLLAKAVDQGKVPGVVAAVVDRDGVRYEGAAGERIIGSGTKMTTDTVGAIFSMTKAITGAAAMQLVEQGKIGLDDPASKICPELGKMQVLDGFDDDGKPILRAAKTDITLRRLLTHTSGLVYEIWNEDCVKYKEATGQPSLFSLEKAALAGPLMFDPGDRWEYGIGIDWAGQMVEKVSGKTLGKYFADHIFGPLGMKDTAFVHTDSMLKRASGVHARMPDGSLAPMELPAVDEPEFEMGGGGLHGTMNDYGRFIRMILNDGELDGVRVLKPETVAMMSVNSMGDLRVSELGTVAPPFSNDAELFPGDPKSWGLTFQINEKPGSTGRPAGTLMWAGLANSYFWIDRENGIGGCYLSQILPFADEGSLSTFMDFETAVYASR